NDRWLRTLEVEVVEHDLQARSANALDVPSGEPQLERPARVHVAQRRGEPRVEGELRCGALERPAEEVFLVIGDERVVVVTPNVIIQSCQRGSKIAHGLAPHDCVQEMGFSRHSRSAASVRWRMTRTFASMSESVRAISPSGSSVQ